MEVAAKGDMANYPEHGREDTYSLHTCRTPQSPGKLVKGIMGGAMDLVSSGSKVIVTMEHTDRKGNPKVLPRCTLPLTGQRVVSLIITEKAVFEVKPDGAGLLLAEVGEGETVESVRAATAADFDVSDALRPMRQ